MRRGAETDRAAEIRRIEQKDFQIVLKLFIAASFPSAFFLFSFEVFFLLFGDFSFAFFFHLLGIHLSRSVLIFLSYQPHQRNLGFRRSQPMAVLGRLPGIASVLRQIFMVDSAPITHANGEVDVQIFATGSE